MGNDLQAARLAEYRARREATRLRRARYEGADVDEQALDLAEDNLRKAESARQAAQDDDKSSGLLGHKTLGARTTGLEVEVKLRMEYVPTAIAHLLTAEADPLVEVAVKNASDETRRVRVTVNIEDVSASAVDSAELDGQERRPFLLLPTLKPAAMREVTELTRATLSVLVEDLDSADHRVEFHRTFPVWLLARSTAPLAVLDPTTGTWRDMTPYFGAFVTPNAPVVQEFLRHVVAKHPEGHLVGYQGEPAATTSESQVQAMFDALKTEAEIVYVNSVLTTSPREGFADQRVRVPRETLANREANCIDGAILYASLIEAVSMSSAIAIVPGHAFVAWETWEDKGEWAYLETTMTATHDFASAREAGEATARRYSRQGELVLHEIARLRTENGISPLE
jgi:hypothetical protein